METLKFLLTSSFYPPYHLGGDAVHVKYLAEELSRIGHEVHVLHSVDAYLLKRKQQLNKNIESNGVHIHSIKTSLNCSPYVAYFLGNSPSILNNFSDLVKSVKPDVIHHHNISLLGYKILQKQGRNLNFYTIHDYWLICQQNNLLRNGKEQCSKPSCIVCSLRCKRLPQLWRYRKDFAKLINGMDLLISPSNFVKKKIMEKIECSILTIPNFVPEPPKNAASPAFSNYFLFAGVLESRKGILNLIHMFKDIQTDAKLLIVGSGPLQSEIEAFIERNSLQRRIICLGWVDYTYMYGLLKGANALLVPSIWAENSPLIVLEALSVGTPVLSSNNGGLPEIISKIDNNLLFNSFDELKYKLLTFSRSDFSSDKIRGIYGKHYSPSAFIASYGQAIHRLRN